MIFSGIRIKSCYFLCWLSASAGVCAALKCLSVNRRCEAQKSLIHPCCFSEVSLVCRGSQSENNRGPEAELCSTSVRIKSNTCLTRKPQSLRPEKGGLPGGKSDLRWRSLSILGLFTSEGRMEREIDRRIGAASAVMRTLNRSVVVKRS